MTKAQEEALRWLRERNGTGVFEMPWASVLVAAGERAPIMRVTWNALHDLGHVTIEGWRVTMTEEPGR